VIIDENVYVQKARSYEVYGKPVSLFAISTQDLCAFLMRRVRHFSTPHEDPTLAVYRTIALRKFFENSFYTTSISVSRSMYATPSSSVCSMSRRMSLLTLPVLHQIRKRCLQRLSAGVFRKRNFPKMCYYDRDHSHHSKRTG